MGHDHVLVVSTPYALEFVKDTVILVKIAQFSPQVVMDGDRLYWFRFHVNIPDLQ